MGYGVHRFVGAVDDNLLCGICSAVLQDAVLTPCGHSFCQQCLDTWLARPCPGSCPACRGKVGSGEARPILSIRNLIYSLDVYCEHRSRGCLAIFKLDSLAVHKDVCEHAPIECAGCGETVDGGRLADHHVQCTVITAMLGEQHMKSALHTREYPDAMHTSWFDTRNSVSELARRVAGLEIQVNKVQKDLEAARSQNSRLDQELTKTRGELEGKRSQLTEYTTVDFDPDYEYGYTPASITKLACLIARFLLKRPAYIDGDHLFSAVKRCYENYGRCHNDYQGDVHMLLATANASNWFSHSQKVTIHCWLQCLNNYRQYKNAQQQQQVSAQCS